MRLVGLLGDDYGRRIRVAVAGRGSHRELGLMRVYLDWELSRQLAVM